MTCTSAAVREDCTQVGGCIWFVGTCIEGPPPSPPPPESDGNNLGLPALIAALALAILAIGALIIYLIHSRDRQRKLDKEIIAGQKEIEFLRDYAVVVERNQELAEETACGPTVPAVVSQPSPEAVVNHGVSEESSLAREPRSVLPMYDETTDGRQIPVSVGRQGRGAGRGRQRAGRDRTARGVTTPSMGKVTKAAGELNFRLPPNDGRPSIRAQLGNAKRQGVGGTVEASPQGARGRGLSSDIPKPLPLEPPLPPGSTTLAYNDPSSPAIPGPLPPKQFRFSTC